MISPFLTHEPVIKMPEYNARVAENMDGYVDKELLPIVIEQLREYVTNLASLYRNNPFHNFVSLFNTSIYTPFFLLLFPLT